MPRFDLPDDCSLRSVRPLHGQLVAALAAEGDLTLDCALVASVDLAGVQLLVSATRTAAVTGKSLRLHAASDALRQACARAGVALSPSADAILIDEV